MEKKPRKKPPEDKSRECGEYTMSGLEDPEARRALDELIYKDVRSLPRRNSLN